MIKKSVKKLYLSRETLQQLDLQGVLGGDYTKTMTVDTKCKSCTEANNSAACNEIM